MPAPSSALNPTAPIRTAIIGAGWAGLAAAIRLVQGGHHVTVLEAARQPGGRARSISINTPRSGAADLLLDNGQHIMIGAYRRTLALMEALELDPAALLLRMPLDLRDFFGHGLCFAQLPAPWHAIAGIVRTRHWSWRERMALLQTLRRWQKQGFRSTGPGQTVQSLCQHLPASIMADLIDPLCVAALNTPIHQASAQVFLRVLQDSAMGPAGSSDLLIPRAPLDALLPAPAMQWLQAHGSQLQLGARAESIAWHHAQASTGQPIQAGHFTVNGQAFDHLVIATHNTEAARLLQNLQQHGQHNHHMAQCLHHWSKHAAQLEQQAIATVYLQDTRVAPGSGTLLPRPMVMLHSTPQAPAQFAFDHGSLRAQTGLLALVTSTSVHNKTDTEQAVLQQARALLPEAQLQAVATIVEKRATFACTPDLQRPAAMPVAQWPSLQVAGDYTDGPYPATIEGAVISGEQAAHALLGLPG